MLWNSGDTFNSTSYTLTIPHVPDNSTVKYYIVATDWLKGQSQSDIRTITVKYDLAITEVKTSKTVVGKGFTAQINVTIANQGTIPNTLLKIALYANTTLLHTQTISFLANGTATTITFYWNTTGEAKGNYKITAFITPILSETDTADNTFIDGTLTITTPGDCNGDRKVDGKDLTIVAGNWLPPKKKIPPGDPRADINGDNKVDGKDLTILAANWQK